MAAQLVSGFLRKRVSVQSIVNRPPRGVEHRTSIYCSLPFGTHVPVMVAQVDSIKIFLEKSLARELGIDDIATDWQSGPKLLETVPTCVTAPSEEA